jgi:site-specific recombinase XerD
METNLKLLIQLCDQELVDREYSLDYHECISNAWEELLQWMLIKDYRSFDELIGYQYCNEIFGSTVLSGIKKIDQVRLRAIRMLISYQKYGDFEFRTPSVYMDLTGQTGKNMEEYLQYLNNTLHLTEDTISNKSRYLLAFNIYLENHRISLEDVSIDTLTDFYTNQNYTLASKHNCNSALKLYLRYAYENGITTKDCSIYVLSDNYKKHCKLPTTYSEEEIKRMIEAVDRASSIGKRDYLILLLASEYGWRSSDIANFSFNQIDWDKNTITFNQHKTGVPVAYPLLSSIGNAIIDYLKNGRPVTETQQIIVSGEVAKKGKKLAEPTIHSIVAKYMKNANISNWKEKKHGPHSLRHSLAANLLKRNVSIPIISTVLGHQTTESTKAYISVDIYQLKKCTLPMPCLKTDIYEV